MKINNNILNPFNNDIFNFIEDIIVVDMPILSHYKKDAKDYLLYLVDRLSHTDKFLLLELSEESLYKYLLGKISLYDVITLNDNFIYLLDINDDGVLLESEIFNANEIVPEYLPAKDSYLDFDAIEESYYYQALKKYNDHLYVEKLKEEAFYIKFNPKTSKYGHTIGFIELSDQLFKKISISFSEYAKYDFLYTFNKKYTHISKLKNVFNKIKDDLDYRLVDANISSFEVGLAIDKTMKNSIQDEDIRAWAKDVGKEFKDEILEMELSEQLLDKFTPEQRKKIFSPIFEVLHNKNVDFEVKDSKVEKYRRIELKDKLLVDKIFPKESGIIDALPSEFEIINVTALVRKGLDTKTIKVDNSNSLFSSSSNASINLTAIDFENHGYKNVDKDIFIEVNISTEKGGVVLFNATYDNENFKAVINNNKLDEGITNIIKQIYEFILNREEP